MMGEKGALTSREADKERPQRIGKKLTDKHRAEGYVTHRTKVDQDYPIWKSTRHPPSEYKKSSYGNRRRNYNRAQKRIAEASDIALGQAFEELRLTRRKRYHSDGWAPFLDALRDWVLCKWHLELGYQTFEQMAAALWVGDLSYWRGWRVMAFLPRTHSLMNLCRRSWWKMRKLGRIHYVITDSNWAYWVTLILHLTEDELVQAARSWEKASKTGYYGDRPLIFIPLWIPQDEYPEELNARGPAWEALKAYSEKARKP